MTEQVSEQCKNLACNTALWISAIYDIWPEKVVVTEEPGFLIRYRNPINGNVLRIEVDNDLDVCAVVSDGCDILASGFMDADDEKKRIFSAFFETTTGAA